MAPLHSAAPLSPISLAAQRFTLSLPLVQLQMPLISNDLQWQSRTLLSRQRRQARRVHRNRGITRTQQQIEPAWSQPEHFGTYLNDEQSLRQSVATPTEALAQPLIDNIESCETSVELPSTEICHLTSDATHGTNVILSIASGAEPDSIIKYIDQDISKFVKEEISNMSSSRVLPPLLPPSKAAKKMAACIIRHARYHKMVKENDMCCPDCGHLLVLPVTGQCGHTRCTRQKGACGCGVAAPEYCHINALVQDITAKMVVHCTQYRPKPSPKGQPLGPCMGLGTFDITSEPALELKMQPLGHSSHNKQTTVPALPVTMQGRYEFCRKLVSAGSYREAVPHLAHVAASQELFAPKARCLLAKVLTALVGERECKVLTRKFYRAVKDLSASAWLQARDLECILCCSMFTDPVTTPCGHTYCRICLERCLDYSKRCALCLRPLNGFDLALTGETYFVSAALQSFNVLPPLPTVDPDIIPIFVCTVAFPSIPCPLFIFNPRYWLMMRRVLESSSRKFGMVAYESNQTESKFGTILQVCDCVRLEDGRLILSTIGISRFRVKERLVRDGCEVARVEPWTDIPPTDPNAIAEMRSDAIHIFFKALVWLNSMNRSTLLDIKSTFGDLPHMQINEPDGAWWETPDGPTWMWWLITILPLKSDIKILILSSQQISKRLAAIRRVLETIEFTNSVGLTGERNFRRIINNAERWLRSRL